eukprot:CAMPEP_0206277944 /NCGR_PEP_ID=MMETSP0047_2-20121206/37143_1 /ASSEMBLY_ACC=CAM_ASM_000192 /TAXON_ID=195065 /ORGANISM="Chroomonas mesostigmatica_cf, Strain CCMP1168" /LENGTH=272 /DNA_ID=CAMNT_0053707629 /DNA_START=157 /DNA_END=975 /DNA_ORIENTATION=-
MRSAGSLLRRGGTLGPRWARQFRLSAETQSPAGLKLMLIRHAESQNNVLQREVEERVRLGQITPEQATKDWLAGRVTDPPLSAKGERESHLLSKHLGPKLVQTGGAVLVSSPMLRALQTTAPLARETGFQCTVMPECFEVGGIYDSGGSGFLTDMLPPTGAWNQFQTEKEPRDRWFDRAVSVSDWVQSPEVRDMADGRPLVMVVHSTFMDLLLKAVLHLPMTHGDDGGSFFHTDNTSMSTLFIPQTWSDGMTGPGPTLLSSNATPHIPTGGA